MSGVNRRGNDLKHSLPSICRALTRQKGIKLVFQGPPRTDGKTIYSNPMPVQANDDEVMIITGNIDHECGHVLYSDFGVLETLKETVPKNRFTLVKYVHNALEDTFIERRLGEAYLGCRETLARSTEILESDGKISIVGTDRPSMALTQYIDAWGRVNVLKQKLEKTLSGCSEVLPQLIGDDGMTKLNEILSTRLPGVTSSSDTMDIALDIEKLLTDTQQEREEQKDETSQSQQAQDNDEENPGDKDSDSSSDQPGNDDQDEDSSVQSQADGQGEGSQSQSDDQEQCQNQGKGSGGKADDSDTDEKSGTQNSGPGEGNKDPQGQNKGQGGHESQGSEAPDSVGQAHAEAAESDTSESGTPTAAAKGATAIIEDQGEYSPLVDRRGASEQAIEVASQSSMLEGGEGGHLQFKPNLDEYRYLHNSSAATITELQRRLVMEYQSRTRRRSVVSEKGRLDGRRLHRAMLGNPMIHRERVKRDMPYPAVSLVMDCSHSMTDQPIILAKQAMIAVAEANRQLGVKTEIIAFAGGDTRVIKPFDVELNARCKAEIGGIIADGGTPTAEALWLAGNRLVARREPRKLLLLVTDGMPNDPDRAIEVAGMVERSGIEIYGIGIGCDAITSFSTRSTVILDASSIAEAVVTAIRTRLLNAA